MSLINPLEQAARLLAAAQVLETPFSLGQDMSSLPRLQQRLVPSLCSVWPAQLHTAWSCKCVVCGSSTLSSTLGLHQAGCSGQVVCCTQSQSQCLP